MTQRLLNFARARLDRNRFRFTHADLVVLIGSWAGSSLLEVGNLAGAVAALQEGRAQGLLWEIGSAQQLVDRGDFVMLNECSPQWPSFVLAARNDFLGCHEGAEIVRNVLDTMADVCMNFEAWPGRFNLVCQKYGYRSSDAKRRLTDMTWSCENIVSDEVLDEVAFTLVAVGILPQFPSTDNMFASLNDLSDEHQPPSNDVNGGSGTMLNAEKCAGREAPVHTVRFEEPVVREKKEKYKQRPPTPFPWDQARKLSGEGVAEDQRQHKQGVYDSSESDEPSYEPDFKKTDEGTVEMTGTAAAEVREAVLHHEMRGKWVKGGNSRRTANKSASPEWKSCVEDEQISALLDKSVMMSSTVAPHRMAGPRMMTDSQQNGLRGFEDNHSTTSISRGLALAHSPAPYKARAESGGKVPESHLNPVDLRSGFKLKDVSLQLRSSPPHRYLTREQDMEGQGSEITDHSDGGGDSASQLKDFSKESAFVSSLAQSASITHLQRQTGQANQPDFESLASTNSGSVNEPCDSEQQRQQKAALNLRKLRDSVVIRRTAAKFKQREDGGSREESVADSLVPIRPAALFARQNVDECGGSNTNARTEKQTSEVSKRLMDHRVNSAPMDESSLRTQSEETSPSAGRANSLERHPAEFRHTLRKSVRRECNTMSSLMPPTALFGSENSLGKVGQTQKDVSHDGCPICLEPTDGGQVHVTTCAHRFHLECYNDYRRNTIMNMRDQCPVCRTSQRSEHAADFPEYSIEESQRSREGEEREAIGLHQLPSARDRAQMVTIGDFDSAAEIERDCGQTQASYPEDSGVAHPSMLRQYRQSSKRLADTPLILESQVTHSCSYIIYFKH